MSSFKLGTQFPTVTKYLLFLHPKLKTMEIKITTKKILQVLHVLSWIVFIGLCVEAGGIIFNTMYTLFFNPIGAQHFWKQIDFSSLYHHDKGFFITAVVLMSIVAVLEALLFYLIVKILGNKNFDLSQPFNIEMKNFIANLSYLAIGIGLFSYWGTSNTKWLQTKGISMPDIQHLGYGGADVWIFMGVTLFVIAQIFKRGVEIQSENDLTI